MDHQRDRDAEDGQAVRVVHGPVEGIHDPDPATPRGGRLARDGTMLPGLFGKDRIARVGGPDGVQDERLGQVVRLRHNVTGALVVDLLETLVAIHERLAGSVGELERERKILGEIGWRQRARARLGRHRHGALHSTARFRATDPSPVTRFVNVIVSPAWICGLRMKPALVPLRSTGSVSRHVVRPSLRP